MKRHIRRFKARLRIMRRAYIAGFTVNRLNDEEMAAWFDMYHV